MHDVSQIATLQTPLPFWKMSGSGNDFVVLDNRCELIPEPLKSEWARRICRRRVSVGADGVVFIEALADAQRGHADVRWRYFNADGSEGEMCGNGAMCGARFAVEQEIAPNPVRMLTCSGVVTASLAAGKVWIDIPAPGPAEMDVVLDDLPVPVRGHRIEVGVPHVVIPVDDADTWPPDGSFDAIGRAIRRHPVFAPAGTNVNVISLSPSGSVRMRTWERGVEAETLACGTGAVASAIVSTVLGNTSPPIAVNTSSGRTLIVEFEFDGNAAHSVRLGGEATVVARGEMMPDAWIDTAEDNSRS